MSSRLTIIGLNLAPEPTGNAPYTSSLATELADRGWTVKVIAGFPHYPQWQVFDGYTGTYRRESLGKAEVLRLRHYVPRRPRFLNRLLMELHFGFQVARTDWGEPDVVLFVSQALFSSGIARLTMPWRRPRTRTAIWVQDIYTRTFEEAHASASGFAVPMRWLEGRILARMDKTIVIHERFQRYVCDRFKLPLDNVEVIRNWSHIIPSHDLDRATIRQQFGWRDDEIVVLHAGNMGVKQYLDNVVEAARLAVQNAPNVRFVLLGGGNQRHHLEDLGKEVANLQFIDPLPDDQYASALAAADILLVNEKPGMREMSVPSKLTSYFVTGRPVLAAVESDGATADEVQASKAGVVVPSGDPMGLLRSAEIMGADCRAASELGAKGPLYAIERLSTEAAVRHWDSVLRDLLAD
ncbi:hypothetical protein AVL61_07760 [Kocuria rosea subsp. polaris]|uniref:Uncharacterized protein n=1 Tax=Kocuria rosea subsp. polaris TaxID=136273 RepID=A0A0W8ILY0_KOCRO|nr:glycosyltransferase family 4 protein [Kocuria polaris]KUG61054.1 hypothetical protein AVL61_07760 [Kocuria polaris]